jgi:hypothetical protein
MVRDVIKEYVEKICYPSELQKFGWVISNSPQFPKGSLLFGRFPSLASRVLSVKQHPYGEKYGALMQWYLQGQKWNYSVEIPFQCHFIHHKSHIEWPGIETGSPLCAVGAQLPETYQP